MVVASFGCQRSFARVVNSSKLLGVVATEVAVVDVAVALVLLHGQASGERIEQRTGDVAAETRRIVVAAFRGESRVQRLARLVRRDVDEARERIRAVQRSLRSAEDLDLADIVERADRADPAEVDMIYDQPNG